MGAQASAVEFGDRSVLVWGKPESLAEQNVHLCRFRKPSKKVPGKFGRRFYKNVGLGFRIPKEASEGVPTICSPNSLLCDTATNTYELKSPQLSTGQDSHAVGG